MAKVNYTKAEEAFEQAMRQRVVDELLESATWLNLLTGTQTYKGNDPHTAKIDKIIEHILAQMKNHLKIVKKHDPAFYEQLGVTQADEQKFSGSPKELTKEDWRTLRRLKEQIAQYHPGTPSKEPEEKPEDLDHIKDQQKEHINKRYNIKKGWLPL